MRQRATLFYCAHKNHSEGAKIAVEERAGVDNKRLQCLQHRSTGCAVKIIRELRQKHLEGRRVACSGRQPFQELWKKDIDEAMGVMSVIAIGVGHGFRQFNGGAYRPGTQADESNVTVLHGSATSNIPERASRKEFTKSCVAAVLFTEGANCID